MDSCLYVGMIRHRRRQPRDNDFAYRVMYAYLDLDEIESVFEGRWLWSTRRAAPLRYRREDYLGPATEPLKQSVLNCVEQRLQRRPTGPVRLLTHLRHFGYCFNPVSFYYVYDAGRLDCILAQITNTDRKSTRLNSSH